MVGDCTRQRKRKEILMKYLCVPVLIVALLAGVSFAGEPLQLKDENERLNYSYGFHFAETLKREGVKINEDTLLRGIQDALSGVEPQMTQEEMGTDRQGISKAKATCQIQRAPDKKRVDSQRRPGVSGCKWEETWGGYLAQRVAVQGD